MRNLAYDAIEEGGTGWVLRGGHTPAATVPPGSTTGRFAIGPGAHPATGRITVAPSNIGHVITVEASLRDRNDLPDVK